MNWRSTAIVWTIGLVAACGPSVDKPPSTAALDYARMACDAVSRCGCAERFDDDQCESVLVERFERALARGLVADSSCLDEFREGLESECTLLSDQLEDGAETCVVLAGDRGEGDSCARHAELPAIAVSECADGLFCHASGRCVASDPVSLSVAGDPCDPTSNGRCVAAGLDDLYCAADGVCREASDEGEPCDSPFGCENDSVTDDFRLLYCEGLGSGATGICARTSLVDEICDPLDPSPCAVNGGGDLEGFEGWCDPSVNVCRLDGPAVCAAFDDPLAWP